MLPFPTPLSLCSCVAGTILLYIYILKPHKEAALKRLEFRGAKSFNFKAEQIQP